ncbi:MAG: hypothetical protein ICV84_19980 [Flavisolibacter sp.]|nr:hypothetical protein [Flavisolibacter sp.]
MNFKDNIAILEASTTKPAKKKSNTKRFTKSLEYELIANLIMHQYQQGDVINYDLLLSIPIEDRIPGLIEEFGVKRTHRLLVMILKEFNNSLYITKSKKLTDTKISVCACDMMIAAHEDQLALEDIILFLERAKQGKYGAIKNLVRHQQLMDLLEKYRQARHEAYMQAKQEKEHQLKALGPVERIANDPMAIGDLLQQTPVIDISNQRMSG